MKEPRYTYTAAAPCFSITNDRPFVLNGCSCGWPGNACKRFHSPSIGERAQKYSATIQWAEQRGGDTSV